jgi:hypothetical protein
MAFILTKVIAKNLAGPELQARRLAIDGKPKSDTLKPAVRKDGGPGKTRTCDLRFRKPLLYPAELRDRLRRLGVARGRALRSYSISPACR